MISSSTWVASGSLRQEVMTFPNLIVGRRTAGTENEIVGNTSDVASINQVSRPSGSLICLGER